MIVRRLRVTKNESTSMEELITVVFLRLNSHILDARRRSNGVEEKAVSYFANFIFARSNRCCHIEFILDMGRLR